MGMYPGHSSMQSMMPFLSLSSSMVPQPQPPGSISFLCMYQWSLQTTVPSPYVSFSILPHPHWAGHHWQNWQKGSAHVMPNRMLWLEATMGQSQSFFIDNLFSLFAQSWCIDAMLYLNERRRDSKQWFHLFWLLCCCYLYYLLHSFLFIYYPFLFLAQDLRLFILGSAGIELSALPLG